MKETVFEYLMMMSDDDSRVAELLIDGCHMGMKSLGKYLRQYENADQKERALAGRLMNIEMELYKKLMVFL